MPHHAPTTPKPKFHTRTIPNPPDRPTDSTHTPPTPPPKNTHTHNPISPGGDRRGGVAALGRRGGHGRGRLLVHHGAHQGAHHHGRRREHRACSVSLVVGVRRVAPFLFSASAAVLVLNLWACGPSAGRSDPPPILPSINPHTNQTSTTPFHHPPLAARPDRARAQGGAARGGQLHGGGRQEEVPHRPLHAQGTSVSPSIRPSVSRSVGWLVACTSVGGWCPPVG